MSEVKINYAIGDVHVVRNGRKIKVEADLFKKSVELEDGDKIITGPHSYVVRLTDRPGPRENGTWMAIFPNSEMGLGIKGGLIIRMELVRGLFKIATGTPPEKEVITPTAELPPTGVMGWIDVAKDGAVVVASEADLIKVVNKKTKKGAVIGFRQQVTVTKEDILGPYGVDQRFKEAYKAWEMLEKSHAKFLYADMLERRGSQELRKEVKVLEEKTGRKFEEYDADYYLKYQKWLEEQKELGERAYEEVQKTELPDFKPRKAEEKITYGADYYLKEYQKWLEEQKERGERKYEEVQKGFESALVRKGLEPVRGHSESPETPKAISKKIPIDKSVNYQGISFKVVSAEKGPKGLNIPEGKEFLVLDVEAKNNSPRQVILFYDEEVRLINESAEVIPIKNYKLENNFDPQSEAKGSLQFLAAKEDNKFKLQFGKKSLSKVEVGFEL